MCLGIPMEVVTIEGTRATVQVKGVRRICDISLLGDEVGVGDHVLVHVGYAIAKVDEEEVKKTWEILDEMLAAEGAISDA
jgi:hydrogenase expression/formation protein HypC